MEVFFQLFSKTSGSTKKHLFDLAMSILALNGYQSVKFNFEHFIAEGSKHDLNSYYYAFNERKIDIEDWTRAIIKSALAMPCADDKQPIILSVDDTLIEKYGGNFENMERLFDHAKRNGDSKYLDDHCFVSMMMSAPISDGDVHRYIDIPLCYRMWKKGKSKLEMTADMARKAMKVIGGTRSVYLCCDSWYPKGQMFSLPEEFANLEIVCNARIDTVLYPPPKKTGKIGRPKLYGDRLSPEDFALEEIKGYNYKVGARIVLTNLFFSGGGGARKSTRL